MIRFLVLTALIVNAVPACAQAPDVVADIAPVHALVAKVMDGVGEPDLIVSPGASPHDYAMRPSQARALNKADLVIWIGEPLTPWMAGPLHNLTQNAHVLTLAQVSDVTVLPFRKGAVFGGHDHAHTEDESEDPHVTAGFDPHLWLDPANATVWVTAIAQALTEIDPAHAELYLGNAATARAELALLTERIASVITPVQGATFFVFHDAYHYFEARFGIEASGALALSDASSPGPARLAEIREVIQTSGARCVFSEPQFNPGIVNAVIEGTDTNTELLDPMGATLTPGPGLYSEMLANMSAAFVRCLK